MFRTLRAALLIFAGTVVLLLGGAGDGHAALAPQFERWRELGIIVNDQSIAEKLFPHGVVSRIEAMQDGTYQVWAGPCFVAVTINFGRPPAPAVPGAPPVSGVTVGDVLCN